MRCSGADASPGYVTGGGSTCADASAGNGFCATGQVNGVASLFSYVDTNSGQIVAQYGTNT